MFRLLGDVRRGETRRRPRRRNASFNFLADVTLACARGRRRLGNNEGESADTATSLNSCAGIGLRYPRMTNATGRTGEATAPRRHLVRLFRACLCFSLRVAHSAEQITELGRLAWALVRFLRRRWCLLGAIGRFRRSGNVGEFAQTAWSLNHIATIDPRAARKKKYNRDNSTGHRPETALGSGVSSLLASFPAGRPSLPGS